MTKRILAVTPGDPAGIGPEVVWKTLKSGSLRRTGYQLLCIGARKPFERLGAPIVPVTDYDQPSPPKGLNHPFIWLLPAPEKAPSRNLLLPGFQSGWSIEAATRLALSGKVDALVTGPISKERLQAGGYDYSGHTDLLADLCGVGEVTMMLANPKLRVSLVTTHIALQDVPKAITREKIQCAVSHTAAHLRDRVGIKRPRIAVAALNPHAGETGLFGQEEIRTIQPALVALRKSARGKFTLSGPFPADTLFTQCGKYDAVICMYHDQGLIPVKLLDFPHTVNLTLGLPIIRTSVDHGVAFDIAWKDRADPSSFNSAVQMAIQLAAKKVRKK